MEENKPKLKRINIYMPEQQKLEVEKLYKKTNIIKNSLILLGVYGLLSVYDHGKFNTINIATEISREVTVQLYIPEDKKAKLEKVVKQLGLSESKFINISIQLLINQINSKEDFFSKLFLK